MKKSHAGTIALVCVFIVLILSLIAYYYIFPLWTAKKAIDTVDNYLDDLAGIVSDINNISSESSSDSNSGSSKLTVVKGVNHELDNIKPVLDEYFGEDSYKISVENNKIVTRIAIPGISDAVAAAEDNGDYSAWNNIISEYIDRNSYISGLTEDNGLSYPVVLYGMNDNDEILFTLSGGSVAFAVIKEPEPESEIDVPEGWTVAGTRGEPTLGEKNALKRAKEYLDTIPFSYEGLIRQLKFEKYSESEAIYGAANCGADWNEQAYLKALDYLDTMSFSRDGLIRQLKYEKFTDEQAEYAANKVGY